MDFNNIRLDSEFVKNSIDTLTDWAREDTRNREVNISVKHGEINISVYDFSSITSVYIQKTDKISDINDIDNILKAEKEKEEREMYEKLKAKFEKKAGDKLD